MNYVFAHLIECQEPFSLRGEKCNSTMFSFIHLTIHSSIPFIITHVGSLTPFCNHVEQAERST